MPKLHCATSHGLWLKDSITKRLKGCPHARRWHQTPSETPAGNIVSCTGNTGNTVWCLSEWSFYVLLVPVWVSSHSLKTWRSSEFVTPKWLYVWEWMGRNENTVRVWRVTGRRATQLMSMLCWPDRTCSSCCNSHFLNYILWFWRKIVTEILSHFGGVNI